MLRWLAILTISFALEGCVMPMFTYFRNYSDQPVDILYSESENRYGPRPTSVKYHQELLPIKKRTWRALNDSLPIVYNGLKASITVPPHSTVMVDRWTITDTSFMLRQSGKTDTISLSTLSERDDRLQYKPSGFLLTLIYYYDFK